MRGTTLRGTMAVVAIVGSCMTGQAGEGAAMFPAVDKYVAARVAEFDQIPSERKAQLKKVSLYVQSRVKAGQPVRLTFICTHNSRRSHLSQIWAATAAAHYGVAGVETFSGGTEATAFNPRAIAAVERAGFTVKKTDETKNPKQEVRFHDAGAPMVCFSKKYDEAPNPKEDFCAVMTCSEADKSCPNVRGASLRMAISYDDPKVADNTLGEAAKYDERCAQIAREMLYLFAQVERE
jgi:arsenate reductase